VLEHDRIDWVAVTAAGFGLLAQMILSDYVSLFVVRKILASPTKSPARSFLFALLAGAAIVSLSVILTLTLLGFLIAPLFIDVAQFADVDSDISFFQAMLLVVFVFLFLAVWSTLIYFWLVLFLLGSLVLRLLVMLMWIVGWAKWFLKGAVERPLRAIGAAAAVVVFTSVAAIKLLVVVM